MKPFKKILVLLLIVFIVIQAFRPAKNVSGENSNSIAKNYPLPEEVKTILVKACNDCHSNQTAYPWYAEIQPVGWWLGNHIKDGKRHFNLDEFSGYRIGRQYKKLQECAEQVKKGEMPLDSYTWIHKKAILTDTEKQALYNWCSMLRDTIKARYAADSLVVPKRKSS